MTTYALENGMVAGTFPYGINWEDQFATPAYTCPKCRQDWYEISDGRYESDGYMAIHRHPAHGHGCMECLWGSRTQQDAWQYLMEQDERDKRRVLGYIIDDLGVDAVLKLLHDTEDDAAEQNAEAWADDEDGYLEWLASNKEV